MLYIKGTSVTIRKHSQIKRKFQYFKLVQRRWDGSFFVLLIWLDIFVTFCGPTRRWAPLISSGHGPVQSGKACALRNPFWEIVRWIILCTCSPSTVIAWPLNANLATEGWSYFHLKCPCMYVCGTALSLSAFIAQMGLPCPLQPIKVMAYVVVL